MIIKQLLEVFGSSKDLDRFVFFENALFIANKEIEYIKKYDDEKEINGLRYVFEMQNKDASEIILKISKDFPSLKFFLSEIEDSENIHIINSWNS